MGWKKLKCESIRQECVPVTDAKITGVGFFRDYNYEVRCGFESSRDYLCTNLCMF